MRVRSARWPDDVAAVCSIDASFVTDRVYFPEYEGLSFRLKERVLEFPFRKSYSIHADDPVERAKWNYCVVAEDGDASVGFAAGQYVLWNRRITLEHLYVSPSHRRLGVGTLLLDSVEEYGRHSGARCIWVETQNLNYPAVRFYLHSGFRFCGFDDSLYDGSEVEEIALFFARSLASAVGSGGDSQDPIREPFAGGPRSPNLSRTRYPSEVQNMEGCIRARCKLSARGAESGPVEAMRRG